MRKFWVIAKESYLKNIKSAGFLIILLAPLIFLLLVIGLAYYMGFFDDSSPENQSYNLALITQDDQLEEIFSSDDNFFPRGSLVLDYETEEEAERAIGEGKLDAYLQLSLDEGRLTGHLFYQEEIALEALVIQQTLNSLQFNLKAGQLGMSQEALQELTQAPDIQVEEVALVGNEVLTNDQENIEQFTKQVLAYFISILILVFILSYSSIMAEEIATEKGSRMMEIILSIVTPRQHFMGKLAGVFLLLASQILIYVVIAIALVHIFQDSQFIEMLTDKIDFNLIFDDLIGYAIIYFLIGMLTYLVTAAFLGSLVTREENISKSVTPLAFIAVLGFFIGNTALADANTRLVQISSYIPYFTPFVMPFRIAAGSIGQWEIPISVLLSILFSILLTLLSSVFYASNVLVYSDTNVWEVLKRSWTISASNRQVSKQRKGN